MRYWIYASSILLIILISGLVWSLSSPWISPQKSTEIRYDGFMRTHVDFPTPTPEPIENYEYFGMKKTEENIKSKKNDDNNAIEVLIKYNNLLEMVLNQMDNNVMKSLFVNDYAVLENDNLLNKIRNYGSKFHVDKAEIIFDANESFNGKGTYRIKVDYKLTWINDKNNHNTSTEYSIVFDITEYNNGIKGEAKIIHITELF